MADDDDADIDYEAARAAELQAICDQQLQELLSKRDIFNATFSKLTPSVANKISTEARRIRNYQSPTLSYGEIEFESFGSLVCSLTKHGVDLGAMRTFIDIGSGTGKAVVCAALMGIFEKCTGIEIIAEVHKDSTQMLKSFFKNCVSISEAVGIDFILGDATFMDWSKTDMIFIHATCFDEATMNRIISTASKMKNGSVVIVLSQRLNCDDLFTLLLTDEMRTSWGTATAYVYMRNGVTAPGAIDDARLRLQQVLSRQIPF